MTMKDAMSAAIAARIHRELFPNLDEMNERQLALIVEELRKAGEMRACPYSNAVFGSANGTERWVMLNLDGSFAVGVESRMRYRSIRDGGLYERLLDVKNLIEPRYNQMLHDRLEAERKEAEAKRLHAAAFAKLYVLGDILITMNQVDNLDMTPAAFDTTLVRMAEADKIEDSYVIEFLDQRKREREMAAAELAALNADPQTAEAGQVEANPLPGGVDLYDALGATEPTRATVGSELVATDEVGVYKVGTGHMAPTYIAPHAFVPPGISAEFQSPSDERGDTTAAEPIEPTVERAEAGM